MKIAIDAMGGDHAPKEIILGINRAIQQFSDLEMLVFGNAEQIEKDLEQKERIHVIHTEEMIEATDEPVRAVRQKKRSSMVQMAQAVANGEADACISAGNTGALMAAGLFIVRRISGIERPALAPTLPTTDGKGFVMLDLGANADAKPEHLYQYALMGNIYAEQVRMVKEPRVALLNIGTEPNKGNELTKNTFELLKDAPFNFIGNVEARDLLEGVADVVVTDGFTGNMVLKSIEGTASSVFSMLKQTLTSSLKNKLAAGLIKGDLLQLRDQMDYTEYGGAALFGLKAPVIKAHGSSNANAIFHAIRQAREIITHDVSGKIMRALQENEK